MFHSVILRFEIYLKLCRARRLKMHVKRPKGLVLYLVLELMEEKPRYGYEILGELEELSGNHWEPSYGTVYGALERMEEEGYIERTEREHEDRKYFEITEKGRERLEKEKKDKREAKGKFREMALGFLNIYRHIYGKEETDKLKEVISEEFEKEVKEKDKE